MLWFYESLTLSFFSSRAIKQKSPALSRRAFVRYSVILW